MEFRKGTRPNLDLLNGNLGKIPQEKINLSLQHPECRAKPEINNVSKILAQGKRSNEPVHERLFKQDILSKKIAVELEAKRDIDSKSRERSRTKSKQVTRERSRGELFQAQNDQLTGQYISNIANGGIVDHRDASLGQQTN